MMKLIITLTALVILYLSYGFYLSQSDFSAVPKELKSENPPGYFDYRGVSNVRTTLSDGSDSPQRVIAQAKLAGLDYIFFTDINLFSRVDNFSGYNGSLLVMSGGEFPFLDSRLHFYSLDEEKFPSSAAEAQIFFTDLLSQHAPRETTDHFVVLAHPFNPEATWTGAYPPGLDGIEILNPRAISQKEWQRSKASVFWSLFTYPFSPKYAFLRLFREPAEEIALWDKLAKQRPTVGISGVEASARAVPVANYLMRFPSYLRSFEIMSNHVILSSELIGNYAKDRQKIFQALKAGHFYMSVDLLGDPRGFNCLLHQDDKTHLMGSKVKFSKNMTIQAQLPRAPKDFYELVLFKDGERVLTVNEPTLSYKVTEPGIYRLLVRVSPTLPIPDGKKWISWIYTNPFYISDPQNR